MADRRTFDWRDQPGEVRNAREALRERIRLTRLAVASERFARAFWPLWTLILVFLAVMMFGAFALLPVVWAKVALGSYIVLAVVFVGLGLWKFRWPDLQVAKRRIDDALPGRPLAAMDDQQVLGNDDPAAMRVWSVHLRRMAEASLRARTAMPDLKLAKHDPWAFRLIGVLAISAAVVFARGGGVASLQQALAPAAAVPAAATGPTFEAWANPPSYTGKPPLYLSDLVGKGPLTLPEGTAITIRIYGGPEGVGLTEDVSGGLTLLSQSAVGIQDAAFLATKDGSLALDGPDGVLAQWAFLITPDAPPTVRLSEPVSRAVSGAMELKYAASDDYGVVEAWVAISLDMAALERRYGLVAEPVAQELLVASMPLPVTGGTGEITETMVEDFSKHVWAGLPVILTLHARDAADQVAMSRELAPALPSRRFFDPLAAAIVEQRRDLLWSPENGARVEQVLKAATWYPQDIFVDRSAYLLARTAIRRLGYARENGLNKAEIDDLAELLWTVALKIEEGDLSDAAEALRRAQERLSEALENGASDQEIAQLTDELREAMQKYMQQMAQEALKNGEQQQAENQNQQTITQDQLQAMLDEIQRLAENGQTEEAQALLEQLRQMMENMQMTMQQGQQGQGQQGQGQQTLQELQDMLQQQQDLADDAFRKLQEQFQQGRDGQQGQQGDQRGGQGEQQGQQGQQGDGDMQGQRMSPGELAQRQEALRQLLEELQQGMPGASGDAGKAARDALREAERDMGGARDNLQGNDLSGALDEQADALEQLREGLRGLAEEMQQQAQSQGRQPGEGMESGQSDTDSRDPLGRPIGTNGSIFSDEQLLPGDEALRRAREILDEIRRRASERNRPKIELDYLRRLLERF